jgi:hypothetical protein
MKRIAPSWIVTATLIVGVCITGMTQTAVAAETAAAEAIPDHPLLRDKWVFALGGYYSRNSTTAALGPSSGGSGIAIDFEDSLDLDKRSLTPMFGFLWRTGERWRVEFEYFSTAREASRTLAEDVEWGDQTYTVGTVVDSKFTFSDARVSAGYSFFRTRDKELGVGFGLHVAGIKAEIDAASTSAEGTDVTAPLPVVNLYGMFALTNEWALRMRAYWLSLTYDNYTGDVRGIGIDVLYQPFRHFGFGLGVRSLMVDVEIDDPDWHGQARISFNGPTAFVTASF